MGNRMFGEDSWPFPTLERRLADQWEDSLTTKPVKLFYDGLTTCFPVLEVEGRTLSTHGSYEFLVRRIEQLKQHQPAADAAREPQTCTCGALERNDPQVAHPGRHLPDCPYRQTYRPPGQKEE